jgi:prepilin-type N-terminal cleavage/methylation domain-containing protein
MRTFRRRDGFTLVEALVALSIALMASAALSLSLTSALQHTDYALEQTIAQGLAEQLLDEALGRDYDDLDDLNDPSLQPLQDRWDVPLGEGDGAGGKRHPAFEVPADYLARWRREIKVYYVDESKPSRPSKQPTNLRAVEVGVYRVDSSGEARLLTTARRVVSYVP